jgi:hypothetical protein
MSERHKTLGDYKPAGPKVRVGADLDSWCTRCRMVLTHTIMAMQAGEVLKVKCNTCGSEHRHREAPPGQARSRTVKKSSGTWAPAPPKKPANAWLEASAGKDLSNPTAYHPKTTFELGQVILHGKFGVGVVMGVKPDGKIIVVFPDDTRIFVHARG